jgi:hypothetical protein
MYSLSICLGKVMNSSPPTMRLLISSVYSLASLTRTCMVCPPSSMMWTRYPSGFLAMDAPAG